MEYRDNSGSSWPGRCRWLHQQIEHASYGDPLLSKRQRSLCQVLDMHKLLAAQFHPDLRLEFCETWWFGLGGTNREQRLPVFDGPAVFDEFRDHGARDFGLNLVHQFHRFNNAEHLANVHMI